MEFKIITAMTVKIIVFRDVTPCILVNVYRRCGRTLLNIYQITRRHIPKCSIFCKYVCAAHFK
jgi:hypothetical protein